MWEGRHGSKMRYAIGAVLAAGLNNVILIAGDHLGFGYVFLSVLCYAVTGTLAYGFHGAVTFRKALSFSSYLLFMGGLLLGLGLSVVCLYVLCTLLGTPMWIAAPVLTVVMFVYNFLSAKFANLRRFTG